MEPGYATGPVFNFYFLNLKIFEKKAPTLGPSGAAPGASTPMRFFYYFGIDRVCELLEFQLSAANSFFDIFEKPKGAPFKNRVKCIIWLT